VIDYPHLATRLFNTPIAILPSKAEVVMAAIADRFGVSHIFRIDGSAVPIVIDLDDQQPGPTITADHGYDLVAGRIAQIEIRGTLVQRLGTLRPFSGMTGYDGIRQNLLTALADDQVEAIVLDIDSPGGEVCGCFDLVDTIVRARGIKPIWAILAENAFSAAYAIASAADVITVPRTGGAGSVGVIYMHVEMAKALEAGGIKVTLITDGDLKGDGNEFEPLSKRAYDKLKADVVSVGDIFRSTVAKNRGLSANAVRDTQAGTFLGREGVDVGFADACIAPSDAMQALLAELG
jgi:signal peptide peptidase SppA